MAQLEQADINSLDHAAAADQLVNRPVGLPGSQSYASAIRRSFPFVVLDFECKEMPDETLSDTTMADFIFDEIGFKKSELTGMRGLSKGNRVAKVLTREPIVVSKRFQDQYEFHRAYRNKNWKCSIRGGRPNSTLRFIGVPKTISNAQLVNSVQTFDTITSEVEMDAFGGRNDPRLRGLTNGHRKVQITPTSEIPDFVSVGERRIRILHKDQVQRCYSCKLEGHIRVNCSKSNETEDLLEPENGDDSNMKSDYQTMQAEESESSMGLEQNICDPTRNQDDE